MDPSEVGKFGTLRLMKRLDPNQVVASYPIDEEEVTIGRDQDCGIRLYYDSVSPQHCKVIFQERKAYVVVFGTSGVLIDGCPVFPASSPTASQVTVPLPNNSTIEINKKRFQFCYPPKELRAMMISTPSRPEEPNPDRRHRRRTLRMSMIQSAQVFTPRPSQDPRENLRVLQSPLKTPFFTRNRRQSSPLKRGMLVTPEEDEEEEEQEIVLVESNHPRVVEEDRDLVILEHVEVQDPIPEPQLLVQFPIPQNNQAVQQTPKRRANPRASLHRAVLIRSAQRAVMRYEMEREEEQEVEEVEDTIGDTEVMRDVQEVEEEKDEEMEEDQDMEEVEREQRRRPVSGWRKSLNAMKEGLGWAFRASSIPDDVQEEGDEDEEEEQDITEAQEEIVQEEDDVEEQFTNYETNEEQYIEQEDMDAHQRPSNAPRDPPSAILGHFMTPQPDRIERQKGFVRYSAGGSTSGGGPGAGPRRVKIVEPWKVSDIIVGKKEEEQEQPQMPPATPVKRERLTEQEKQAIRERRKSAVTVPDSFFGGHTPGSRTFSRLQSLSPTKAAPIAALAVSDTILEVKEEEEKEEDTQIMLERMKQMVEGVKQRQSMGPRPSVGTGLSPRKPSGFSLLAPGGEESAPRIFDAEQVEDESFDKENEPKTEDVEMTVAEESSEPKPIFRAPTTPKFSGMREMFREAAEEMHTPKMDGLRNLFRPERVSETPAFEGLGEMLVTPSEYQEKEPLTELEKPKPIPARMAQSRKPPSTSRLPATTRRTVTRSALPRTESPVEKIPEEAGPSNLPEAKQKLTAARVSRKPRSRTADTQEDVNTSGRASRPQSATKEIEKEEHVSDHLRERTKSGGSSKSTNSSELSNTLTKPTARRTRKAPESSTVTPSEEPVGRTRSLRKPRAGSKTPITEEKPPSKTTSTRRVAAKIKANTEVEDPLDSIPRSRSPEKDANKETPATAARVRRSARKVDTIKEEDVEEDSSSLSTPTEETKVAPRTRTRKTTTTTTAVPRTVAATTSRTATGRTRAAAAGKKVPASEPPKRSTAVTPGDKENTPEPMDDDEPEAGTSGKAGAKVATKGKTVRGAAKARVTAEPESSKTTRVSRARTTKK